MKISGAAVGAKASGAAVGAEVSGAAVSAKVFGAAVGAKVSGTVADVNESGTAVVAIESGAGVRASDTAAGVFVFSFFSHSYSASSSASSWSSSSSFIVRGWDNHPPADPVREPLSSRLGGRPTVFVRELGSSPSLCLRCWRWRSSLRVACSGPVRRGCSTRLIRCWSFPRRHSVV